MKAPVLATPPNWIPPNPLATTPLTLYIGQLYSLSYYSSIIINCRIWTEGKIPNDLDDAILVKILEVCIKSTFVIKDLLI